MERGLYAAASGMLAQQAIQDTLAQNIANANTVGYKQDNHVFSAMQGMALRRLNEGNGRGPKIGELGTGVAADRIYTDWQTGPLMQTGNPLDASLGDNQFFAIRTPRGERYTRAGNFQTDATGRLMTAAGHEVLDVNNQPITTAGRGKITLDGSGNLLSNGQKIAQLKVVQADTKSLSKEGDNLFTANIPTALQAMQRPMVRPGTLEQSNMSPVQGMVQMLVVSRSFEMAQRALTTQDELLRQAATELGKV
jgi:flagellar basal-body rod protein FlgF